MRTKSREVIWGGRIMGAKIQAIHARRLQPWEPPAGRRNPICAGGPLGVV